MGCGQTFDAIAFSVYHKLSSGQTQSHAKTWDFYVTKLDSDRQQIEYPKEIKIWPMAVIAAWETREVKGTWRSRKLSGAARVYFLAKALDRKGSGFIEHPTLIAYLDHLGVNKRTQRRWIAAARKLGLMVEGRRKKTGICTYSLCSYKYAPWALGAKKAGRPSTIRAREFASKDWRAYTWAAYLATLPPNQPISQKITARWTGVPERTQRNYQRIVPIKQISNYADRGGGDQKKAAQISDEYGVQVFKRKYSETLIQRLPNIRVVSLDLSKSLKRGRSRKAQKVINSWCVKALGKGYRPARLFYQSDDAKKLEDSIQAAKKRIKKSETPEHMPKELFKLDRKRMYSGRNHWEVVPIPVVKPKPLEHCAHLG